MSRTNRLAPRIGRLAARLWPKSEMLRNALVAVVVVLVFELVAMWGETTPVWERWARVDRDLFMRAYAGDIIDPRTAQPLAFIDIDDDAFAAWGKSTVTDRGKLLQLIEYASQSGAAVVIVDVDLPLPDIQHGDNAKPGDDALLNYVRGYGAKGEQVPPLIFITSFEGRAKPGVAREPIASLLDATQGGQDGAKSPVHFASVDFHRDSDQVVRDWHLWQPVCREGTPMGLPSVELLTLALMDDPANGASTLGHALNQAVGGTCAQLRLAALPPLTFEHHRPVDLYPDEFGQRILYTLPWRPGPLESPTLEDAGGKRGRLILRIPALPISEHDFAPDPVRGRIVVIGGNNAESRDIYLTPIGAMPGAMILLNAVNSLLQQGQLRAPPTWLSLSVGVALGMVVWLVLYVFQFAIAVVLASATVSLLVWALASRWIAAGMWFDLGVPTFALFAHRWYTVLETLWHDRHRHGWRALLAPAFRRDEEPAAAKGHRRARRHATIAIVLAACAAAAPTRADTQPVVAGYITEIDGASSDCSIMRGSEPIPVHYWSEIDVGDIVSVHGVGYVKIGWDEKATTFQVKAGNSPLKINAPARHGMVMQGLDYAGQALTEWSDGDEVQAKIRNVKDAGPLELPLLSGSTPGRVVAGNRQFTLAWTGGSPPFHVTLAAMSGGAGQEWKAVGDRRVSAKLRLPEGQYEARVTDDHRLTVIGALEVSSAAPTEDDAGLAEFPPGVARLLAAARLSDMDTGAWRLEAYERLTELAGTSRAARLMAGRLAQGLQLSDLNRH